MRSKNLVLFFVVTILSGNIENGFADFVPGNLVVYRVGTGGSALTDQATAVFLDEYDPSGSLIQSVDMTNSGTIAFAAQGTAAAEGLITLSADGTHLVVPGYAVAPGTATTLALNTSSTTTSTNDGPILRTAALVGSNEAINSSTTTTRFSGQSIRSAAYDPAANSGAGAIWMTGGSSGVVFSLVGGSGAGTQVSTTPGGLRQVNIFDGQLYVSADSGMLRLGTVGTGEPTTTGQTITNLPANFPTSDMSPFAFYFADLNNPGDGVDTLYVASEDDNALTKFSFVAGTWIDNGTIGTNSQNYRGLTGTVSGSTVTLYAIRGADELVSLVDATGHNGAFSGTPTFLAMAAANTAFRGVAFAPTAVPEPSAILFGGLVCLVLGLAAVGNQWMKKATPEIAT